MSDYKLYNCGNVENIRHELCRNLLQPKNHTCKLHSIEQLHLLRFSGACVFTANKSRTVSLLMSRCKLKDTEPSNSWTF